MTPYQRLGKTTRGRVALRVLLYGGAIFLGLPIAFCHVMTSVPRPTLERSPTGYEEVRVESEGLHLRGWLARGDTGRPAALVIPGLGDSIESYGRLAGILHHRGHSVLLLDLRAHGGSEGKRTTLGDHEREDVRAGMERLKAEHLADSGVILLGHSMGAVSVLRAAAGRSDVRAVIVEAPFDTMRHTIAHHAMLLYHIPSWLPIVPTSIKFAELWAGFDADRIDAVAAAREMRAPLLLIADGADPRMPADVVHPVFEAHPGPKQLWTVPGADHLGAVASADYEGKLAGFLAENGL